MLANVGCKRLSNLWDGILSQGRSRINCTSNFIHENKTAKIIETGIIFKNFTIKLNIAILLSFINDGIHKQGDLTPSLISE